MQRRMRLSDICKQFGLQYIGNDFWINGLNLCNRKSYHDCILTYVTNESYTEKIYENQAVKGVLLSKDLLNIYQADLKEKNIAFVICDEPEKIFYDIHDYLYYRTDFYDKFDFPARIGEGGRIHASAVIEDGVVIGKNVTIGANAVIKRGTVIKENCVVGCNTTIGSEGFQIIKRGGTNRRVVHCGGLLIEDEVNIGDNVTICNSLFENTSHIGKGVMIDNNAYIAHNVVIGENAVITSAVVLCGSSVVESGAWIGVNSSVLNRVTVGSDSKIGIGSVVTKDIPQGSLAYGIPAKVKLIFGGGRSLGVKVLRWLCSLEWVEICAVCPIPKEYDMAAADEMRAVIMENQLPEYTMDEIKDMYFDVGLSVNYHKIIPAEILSLCTKGFYNIHHSYNLRLKGRNITTHAILNARKEGIHYHGTTLHMMVPELDAGPIVASAACEIRENDTAYTLFERVDALALQLIKEWFPRIAFETIYTYMPPEEGVHCYKNKDLPPKEIPLRELNSDEFFDYVRAFDFPGNEPAFIIEKGIKKHLVVQAREGYEKKILIKDKYYYTDSESI